MWDVHAYFSEASWQPGDPLPYDYEEVILDINNYKSPSQIIEAIRELSKKKTLQYVQCFRVYDRDINVNFNPYEWIKEIYEEFEYLY
jgi:hypothetical protein